MTVPLILASTSPARLALLRAAGVEPVVIPSEVDEPAAVDREEERIGRALTTAETVGLLARAKAEAVLDTRGGLDGELDGLLLGGDSAFELDGMVHGKPHTPERARERWLAQRGRTGILHSGHWLIDLRRESPDRGRAVGEAAAASVSFADDITDEEIDRYVATGEPLLVAGAFTIDSLGGPLIRRIEGDPSTVVGLSLPTLRTLSRRLGVEFADLWTG